MSQQLPYFQMFFILERSDHPNPSLPGGADRPCEECINEVNQEYFESKSFFPPFHLYRSYWKSV